MALTGQASFIQQHSSMLWIRKSLKQPPLAHRNEWNRLIWYINSLMPSGFGPLKAEPTGPVWR